MTTPDQPIAADIAADIAAVLPDHRRQVLDEAAGALLALDPVDAALAGQHAWADAAETVRRLAATVPETGPSGRVAAETGPAVPEATPHARGREELLAEVLAALRDDAAFDAFAARYGNDLDGWALPDEPGPEVAAVRNRSGGIWDRDGDGWRYRVSGNIPGVRGTWRRWDGLVITEGPLTDATPAETGRAPARIDGDGRTGAGAGERVDDGAETRSGGRDG